MHLLVFLPAAIIALGAVQYQQTIPVSPPAMLEHVASTKLKPNANGHILTAAKLNGVEIKVLIDTGASAVGISYEDAERIGLKPQELTFNIPVVTATGIVKAADVQLDWIEVNGVGVADIPGLVLPKGVMEVSLLGTGFLSHLKYSYLEDGILLLEN